MRLTVAHIFYNQHEMLQVHKDAWSQHSPGAVRYSIIDDCSAEPVMDMFDDLNVDRYRITSDIAWNIAGARNLAFHSATTEWVLCADIDHIVSAEALNKIMALDLTDENVGYIFARQTRDGKVGCQAVINILMTRRKFFEVGGYDEDFSGHYGGEETFFRRCLRKSRVRLVHCSDIILDWYPKEGRTWELSRDREVNRLLFEEKSARLADGSYINGEIIRFSWGKMNM